jgi:hypothetical protein
MNRTTNLVIRGVCTKHLPTKISNLYYIQYTRKDWNLPFTFLETQTLLRVYQETARPQAQRCARAGAGRDAGPAHGVEYGEGVRRTFDSHLVSHRSICVYIYRLSFRKLLTSQTLTPTNHL